MSRMGIELRYGYAPRTERFTSPTHRVRLMLDDDTGELWDGMQDRAVPEEDTNQT